MNILVAGASGYIASRLIPRLLDSGHRVRAMARSPHLLGTRSWSGKIDMLRADATDPNSLAPAMKDIHTAYYLIHNMSQGHGYTDLELQAARNFAHAAEEAGVQHIIYLGGLADPEQHIAPHMRSRIETGSVLRQGKVPVTEFRAGVIAGSGSISFEMIRFMTELLPVIPAPTWMHNKSQPIAIQNIIDYLLAALDAPHGHGQVFEIGGPVVAEYKDLMLRYADQRGIKRWFILFPYIPVWFMAFGIDLMTPVPYPIAYALIQGLSADSVVKHDEALKVFPHIKLISFDEAARDALAQLHPHHIEHIWQSGIKAKTIKHEGFFIRHQTVTIHKEPGKFIDSLLAYAKKKHWQVEEHTSSTLLFKLPKRKYGVEWLEWRFTNTTMTITHYFAPHGFFGFLYGYASSIVPLKIFTEI